MSKEISDFKAELKQLKVDIENSASALEIQTIDKPKLMAETVATVTTYAPLSDGVEFDDPVSGRDDQSPIVVEPTDQKVEAEAPVEEVKSPTIEPNPIAASVVTENSTVQDPAVPTYRTSKKKQEKREKTDIEKFIGENLINKIGILIIIIGVAIGAKYAFEHQLVSPTVRIILGYLIGGTLLGFAFKLKKKHETFSIVLLSGAMAICYFMTYFAYEFYGLMPRGVAFVIMVAITVFAVMSALKYDKQVIAVIGQIGAYVVPFLVGGDSGSFVAFFSYVLIINLGVLFVAMKKYWMVMYRISYVSTWLLFAVDMIISEKQPFSSVFPFLLIFFAIFYFAFLYHKVKFNAKLESGNVALLVSNSAVFYGLGYLLFSRFHWGEYWLGVFTLFNSAIHFVVGFALYKKNLVDRTLHMLLIVSLWCSLQ
ncbi:MAG: DUF2339 domain-containing protein [Paludibacteraceae bacterium]|nr:DUF2339 domain-containing protein [Paludibacteraceae bacterium]